MIRYVAGRLRSMVPTLIGISLVTFALVQLAPGDPVALQLEGGMRAGAISSRVVEDFRHAYFLDLPAFINVDPLDARRRVENDVVGLGHEDRRNASIEGLGRTGGAALPHLIPRIPGTQGELREGLLDALGRIAERCGIADELAASDDRAAFWAEYWDTYGLDYTPGRARRLVRRLVRSNDPLARAEIRRLHTFALPQLMEALGDDPSPVEARRIVALLVEVTGRGAAIPGDADAQQRRDAIASWQEWWRRERSRYEAMDPLARAAAVVTETRYFKWIARMATLSFGVSLRDGRPVADKLLEKLPVTLLISLLAVALAYGLAIPLGVISALKRDRPIDKVLSLTLFALYSLPVFWVSTLLLRYLCGVEGPAVFPLGGLTSDGSEAWPWYARIADLAHHLVLPVVCLSYVSLAVLSRYQRVAMLDALSQDYVRTARAKGLRESRVVIGHALRNALLPVVTLLGLQLPYLISGSVIVESVFNIPGMGLETFEAIRGHDYNWIMAVVTLSAVLTMLGILMSDLLYALIDPRVRLESASVGEEAR